jgi:hypothetical protein
MALFRHTKSFFGNHEILFNLAPDKNFPVAAVPSLATKTFMIYDL